MFKKTPVFFLLYIEKNSLASLWIRKNANAGFAILRIHIIVSHNLRIQIRIESGFVNPDSQRLQGFAFCEFLDSHCESNVVNLDPQRLRDSRIRHSRFAWIRKIWFAWICKDPQCESMDSQNTGYNTLTKEEKFRINNGKCHNFR